MNNWKGCTVLKVTIVLRGSGAATVLLKETQHSAKDSKI